MTEIDYSQRVVTYYESKTRSILKRYGPGPRVHFHTGFVTSRPRVTSMQLLRQRLVASQEQLLHHAANSWGLHSLPHDAILDVGCGIGGGAIFWAQELGSRVTAITLVRSHIELVNRFAAQAGVARRVLPLLCDALAVPGESCFDAATAFDSSCHLSRRPWFRRLVKLLRPGGYVLIADCFLGRSEYKTIFNDYWCAQIGTIDEYIDAARDAGLQTVNVENISRHVKDFWSLTSSLSRAEARKRGTKRSEQERVKKSIRMHSSMRRGLVDGGLLYALLSFKKAA